MVLHTIFIINNNEMFQCVTGFLTLVFSQGSLTTTLSFGGIFNYNFNRNLLLNRAVKDL